MKSILKCISEFSTALVALKKKKRGGEKSVSELVKLIGKAFRDGDFEKDVNPSAVRIFYLPNLRLFVHVGCFDSRTVRVYLNRPRMIFANHEEE